MKYLVIKPFAYYLNGKTTEFKPGETCTSEQILAHDSDLLKAECIKPVEDEEKEEEPNGLHA